MKSISVIGIGKLGLCLALNLEKAGFEIIGIDKDPSYVDLINKKNLVSYEPFVQEYLKSAKNFHATTDFCECLKSEVIFIIVPTPSLQDGRYDHSLVDSVIEQFVKLGNQTSKRHIVVSSTVQPRYCDKIAKQIEPFNYTLTYNPEFIAQGSIIQDQQYQDMVLIGERSKEAGDVLETIYKQMCKNDPFIHRMKLLSAEITKIALNCFITTKISFANSIGDLSETVGAETEKILSAIGSDSKIGSKCLKYGYGYGGPCLPRDNRALWIFGKENGIDLLISKTTDDSNEQHLKFQFEQLSNYSKQNSITFEGVTYKKGTVILEESQSLRLAIKLANNGYKVRIKDKEVVIDELKKRYGTLFDFETV